MIKYIVVSGFSGNKKLCLCSAEKTKNLQYLMYCTSFVQFKKKKRLEGEVSNVA